MKRLFSEHEMRKTIDLCGDWKFLKDPDKKGESEGWQNGLPGGETVIVPSVWNTELAQLTYEGMGWYEKKFKTNGGTIRLEFGSVMTKADVWLDGVKIGEHYGAFSQFEFLVRDVAQGEHTLIVRADSSFNEKSFPQSYTDWYNYGGIAREVQVDELTGVCILNNHIVYELDGELKNASVRAELELYNASNEAVSTPITVTVGDTVIVNENVTLDAGETKTLNSSPVTMSVVLWNTDNPYLYPVVAKTETDDLIDRVGFRKIEVKNNNILLNNKSIELLGVNRHEEHPDWGFAFPAKLMKKDIDMICDLGCNTIRGSHYPQSQIFVDMLDARGILFWSEIPMWGVGFGKEALEDSDVVACGLNMHREMTRYYYNHPSIIIWGMHNEIYTFIPCTYDISKQYSEHLRKHGGNRLITHAANHPFEDESMDFDDIICLNLYHGWYNGTLADWDKLVKDFGERINNKGWAGKPVIMSEFGAAALAGYHSHFDRVRWSEEFQSDLLEYCLELFHKTDYMRGTYVWQFSNIRTSLRMDLNRARYFNNKGIVDEYRNPKAAYFKVKELYHRFAKEGK